MRRAQRALVRLANRGGQHATRLGISWADLCPTNLRRQAAACTGLSDFGGDDYVVGLEQVIRSAEHDAGLHFIGRVLLRQQILLALCNRLRLVESRRRRPELGARSLARPIFVTGLPRSGTTHLHRLLAQAPDARAIPLWELVAPIPAPGRDRRRRHTAWRLQVGRLLAPGIDAKHHVRVDSAEECVPLFDASFVSPTFWMVWPLYGYLDWYLEQDKRPAYRHYRDLLCFLQAQDPTRRLVLKAPVHAGALPELLEAIPEARIVQIHRDPLQVAPSLNSLLRTVHSAHTDRPNAERITAATLRILDWIMARTLQAREQLPAGRVLDVAYHDVRDRPLQLLDVIHRHFELPPERELTRDYQRANPYGKHGLHLVRPEDLGVSEAALRQRWQAYRERFQPLIAAKL